MALTLSLAGCGGGDQRGEGAADAAVAVDGSPQPDADPDRVVVTNTPTCATEAFVSPVLPGEAGHLAAGMLTPTRYPVTIDEVEYIVTGGGGADPCDAGLPHAVQVHVVEGSTPSNTPSTLPTTQVHELDAGAAGAARRTVTVTLSPPLRLLEGQRLVVGVAQAADAGGAHSICLATCRDGNGRPGLSWWSNAATEPYDWADLVADFHFTSDVIVRARGPAE